MAVPADTPESSAAPALSPEQLFRLKVLGALPLALVAGAYVGQILSATLLARLPVLLLALTPTDPFLILVVNEVPVWVFFLVGFTRLVLPDPFLYLLGHEFGPHGREYIEYELGPHNRITRTIDVLDRWFPRLGSAIVFLLPNYPVCLLAGITRMRPAMFAVLNAAGTATRLFVIWRLGRLFSGPVETVLGWVTRYQLPFTAAMVVLVVVQISFSRKGEHHD